MRKNLVSRKVTGHGSDASSRVRPRTLVLLLLAAAVITTSTAATAALLGGDEQAPATVLQPTLNRLFVDEQCVTAAKATAEIRSSLEALGLSDWTIASRPGASAEGCVAAGIIETDKQVVLVPVNRPEVAAAMQGVAEELMGHCFGKDQATQLITSVLTGLGVSRFSIVTDGPVGGYPPAQEEAVFSHIESGCYVYSGSGHDESGQPMFGISGPESLNQTT